MGLAERWLGKGADVDNFLVLDLGYGIGMAIFTDRELYTGSVYKSGEIGHIVVQKEGPVCTCGKKGCLEVYASGRGITRIAADIVAQNKSKILEELIHGDAKSVTAQDVALAASMNDELSLKVVREAGEYIGTALSYAVNILNPRKIVIGGGLTGAGKPLFDSIQGALSTHTMKEIMADVTVEQSELGIDISAMGSALVAMAHVFKPKRSDTV
jgi:glucokinase